MMPTQRRAVPMMPRSLTMALEAHMLHAKLLSLPSGRSCGHWSSASAGWAQLLAESLDDCWHRFGPPTPDRHPPARAPQRQMLLQRAQSALVQCLLASL